MVRMLASIIWSSTDRSSPLKVIARKYVYWLKFVAGIIVCTTNDMICFRLGSSYILIQFFFSFRNGGARTRVHETAFSSPICAIAISTHICAIAF